MEKLCAYCVWWDIDPTVRAKLPKNERQKLEATQAMYGKCRARYTDQEEVEQFYDEGTMGATKCQATDDTGNDLFDEVPKG
jgi:hypothetical protein